MTAQPFTAETARRLTLDAIAARIEAVAAESARRFSAGIDADDLEAELDRLEALYHRRNV